ncbi:MAG: transposase [Sphaerochaetaceae bacterium]|nr:transposase [Sphaerochaetaceae bacterium]
MSSWSLLAYNQLKGLEEAFEREINKAIMWNIDETSIINIHSKKKTKLLIDYEKDILKIQEDGFKKKLPEDDIAAMVEEKKFEYLKESPNARNCFMFVRSATNQDGSRGLVMYNYAENRTNDYIKEFIGDYHGIIQSDGLAGYASAAKDKSFTHLGWLIHYLRRIVIQEDYYKAI